MTRFVLCGLVRKKVLLVAACVLVSLWLQTPLAMAQRGGHVGGGNVAGGVPASSPHVSVPPAGHAAIPRPRAVAGPHRAAVGAPFAFGRPTGVFRRRFFFGAPFFRFGSGFNSFWCPECCPYWAWGVYCNSLPFLGYSPENYVTLPPYEVPVYLYAAVEHALVWLYLKDGTVYNVADYWFVNGQVHFVAAEQGAAELVEDVIGFDELDSQKTIEVNSHRGFRVVMRDEPLEQYLRDHPDANPPLLQTSPKN